MEEILSAYFFLSVVFAKVKELEDVGMPGFDVGREGTWPLVAALVNVARCGLIGTEHRRDHIRVAICSCDVRPVER